MSQVTVIGFESSQAGLDRERDFIRTINDATLQSLLTIARHTGVSPYARIITVRRMKAEIQRFGDPPDRYSSVYFLNQAAVDMCEEIELKLPKIGEADEMPAQASYEIQAYYLPFEHRNLL